MSLELGTRRGFLTGLAALITAPAIIKVENLMPIKLIDLYNTRCGLHSSEENVQYKITNDLQIVDRDVASYYPRLITTLKLYPASCGPNFLVAFEKIIAIRLDAKAKNGVDFLNAGYDYNAHTKL